MTTNNQRQQGVYAFLTKPGVYSFSQKISGVNKLYRKIAEDYINIYSDAAVLDIGCGTADILHFINPGISYVGVDMNQMYIDHAVKRYGNRASFFCKNVSEIESQQSGKFDLIISISVVHHLNDKEAEHLYRSGYEMLKQGGRMITVDHGFMKGQGFLSRFISKMDRGKHVRNIEEYEKLARTTFSNVCKKIHTDLIGLPQTACILSCVK